MMNTIRLTAQNDPVLNDLDGMMRSLDFYDWISMNVRKEQAKALEWIKAVALDALLFLVFKLLTQSFIHHLQKQIGYLSRIDYEANYKKIYTRLIKVETGIGRIQAIQGALTKDDSRFVNSFQKDMNRLLTVLKAYHVQLKDKLSAFDQAHHHSPFEIVSQASLWERRVAVYPYKC